MNRPLRQLFSGSFCAFLLSLLLAVVPREAAAQQQSIDAIARRQRVFEARSACQSARSFDWFGLSGTIALGGAGIAMTAVNFTTPALQRTTSTVLLGSMGPGLILGAIGVPLGRGWLSTNDPLRTSCDGLVTEPDDATLVATEGLLRANGAPLSIALPLLLAGGTLLTGGGVALGYALQSPELLQVMGGLLAAVVTAWVVLPPTPMQLAARRYRGRTITEGGVPLQATLLPTLNGGVVVVGGRF